MPDLTQIATLSPDWLFIGRVIIAILLALIGLYLTVTVLMFAINQFAVVVLGNFLLSSGRSIVEYSVPLLKKKYTAIFGRILLEIANMIFRGYLFFAQFMQKVLVAAIALFFPAITLFLIFALFAFEPINIGKIFIATFMFVLSVLFIILILQCRSMAANLAKLETNMIELRDEVMFNGTLVRAQLASLNNRLAKKEVVTVDDFSKQMVQSVGPLVWLFLRKETSIIQWAMAGINLGKTVLSFFRKKSK